MISAALAAYWAHLNRGIRVEYLVPHNELPDSITRLASSIERLPKRTEIDDFGLRIRKHGLNADPDHWKDFNYYWKIPTAVDMEQQYVLTGHFVPLDDGNSGLFLETAAIRIEERGAILSWTQVFRVTHTN